MAEPTLPTQKFVEVKEIRDGVVHLAGGGLRRVLIVSGINFDLKSAEEQELVLGGFQNFLNGLEFPIQIFIHSRKVNVNEYLKKAGERKEKEPNELLRIQIEEYAGFIKTFVEENAIISKTFFVVVPYDAAPVGGTRGALSVFKDLIPGKAGGGGEKTKEDESLQRSLEQLDYRVNEVVEGLGQIGLRTTVLTDEELVELFYNLYNPQLVEKKGLEIK